MKDYFKVTALWKDNFRGHAFVLGPYSLKAIPAGGENSGYKSPFMASTDRNSSNIETTICGRDDRQDLTDGNLFDLWHYRCPDLRPPSDRSKTSICPSLSLLPQSTVEYNTNRSFVLSACDGPRLGVAAVDKNRPDKSFFHDTEQDRIYRRLRYIGEGPAEFYRDACRLMEGDLALGSRTHLVAHLMREIDSAILSVIAPQQEGDEDKTESGDERGRRIHAAVQELGLDTSEPFVSTWLKLNLHRRAHRKALGRPAPVDQEFQELWQSYQDILDHVLDRFEARYLRFERLVDELVATAQPTKKDLKQLRNAMPNAPAAFERFFDRLQNPMWLELRDSKVFFAHPPEPEANPEERSISYSGWPQSRYLARVAKLAPDRVMSIAAGIQTDNIRVHADLIEAALAVPAHSAVRLVPSVSTWLDLPQAPLVPEDLGKLIGHLASGGEVAAALDVARGVLAVVRVPRSGLKIGNIEMPPEARGRLDDWYYGEILKTYLAEVVPSDGDETLNLLLDLLGQALALSNRRGAEGAPEDLSFIWRRAIEDHPQNRVTDVLDLLVWSIREAAERVVVDGRVTVAEIVRKLEQHDWFVVRRIALHLLRRYRADAFPLIRSRLLDRSNFDERHLRHEYVLLVSQEFPHLSADDQLAILTWVDEGLPRERVAAGLAQQFGRAATEEEIDRVVDLWRRDRLAPLSGNLPQEWEQRYRELVAQLGPAEHPEFLSYTIDWSGPRSPKTPEDLRQMEVVAVVEFLKSWQAPGGPWGPSMEGLASTLTSVVAMAPERYAVEAERFAGVDPGYVYAVIEGLQRAAKEKLDFPWRPDLVLGRMLAQSARDTTVSDRVKVDSTWDYSAGRSLLDLLDAGLSVEPPLLPIGLREEVWSIIAALAESGDPDPEYERDYLAKNRDPADLALNSLRPRAIWMAVRYGQWVLRELSRDASGSQVIATGFDAMPEVRDLLDRHLDPAVDSSVAVRSVYGQLLPTLAELDRAWVVGNLPNLFPSDDERRPLRDAVWNTYVVYWRPGADTFALLRGEYERAVVSVRSPAIEPTAGYSPDAKLGEHLAWLCAFGVIDPANADGLLGSFFSAADDQLRWHVLDEVGRWLASEKGSIAPEVLDRLRRFWEWYFQEHLPTIASSAGNGGIAAFGQWFGSGKFDPSWSLAQLHEVLRLGGRVTPGFLVVEELGKIASKAPLIAVQCLQLMVEGVADRWEILGWQDEARSVLAEGLRSANVEARALAHDLINRLAARGYPGFDAVLQSVDPDE